MLGKRKEGISNRNNDQCLYVFFWPSLFILGVAHDSFENDGEQKSIHLQTAAAVFLTEDWHHIIGNYIHSNLMLRVSIFSVWWCGTV